MYRRECPNKNVLWNSTAVQLTGVFPKVNLQNAHIDIYYTTFATTSLVQC